VSGYIDLHCHYLASLDDGVRSVEEGKQLLVGLGKLGFSQVFATPHMRPGMFDNDKTRLEAAFSSLAPQLHGPGVPELALSCEHTFDDVVYERLLAGQGVPYPPGNAVLLEFYASQLPLTLEQSFARLRKCGLTPVIAHPERAPALWDDPDRLERLLDVGAAALLDTAAVVGKYGKRPERAAWDFLERGLYTAACSDAHRPSDVAGVQEGMARIAARYGPEELSLLFHDGPRNILKGSPSL
jgi:protein-tyrosine phosphatase